MSEDIDPDNIDQMIEILQKETGEGHFDRTVIKSRLDEILNAVGTFVPEDDMSEQDIADGKAFCEVPGKENDIHKEKAQHYEKILASKDPFGEGLIVSIYKAEINARARGRKLPGFNNTNLTVRPSHDTALLRKVAEELKNYHELMVKQGSPIKQPQQTLLPIIADLYVELTNKDIDCFDLPHSRGSRFIQFYHLALKPHSPATEAGTDALSKAWKRLKHAEKPGT